jgi:hypothetical protein
MELDASHPRPQLFTVPRKLFTPETARAAALKSHAENSRRFMPKPAEAIPGQPAGITKPFPNVLPQDAFVCEMLQTVRDRMRELLHRMRGAPNGCDKHAAALAKLGEIERQWAGRPMPGSLKPAQPKSTRSSAFVTSGAPEPEPATDPIPPPDLLAPPTSE